MHSSTLHTKHKTRTHRISQADFTVLGYKVSVFLFWNEEVGKTSALTAGVSIFSSVNVWHALSPWKIYATFMLGKIRWSLMMVRLSSTFSQVFALLSANLFPLQHMRNHSSVPWNTDDPCIVFQQLWKWAECRLRGHLGLEWGEKTPPYLIVA